MKNLYMVCMIFSMGFILNFYASPYYSQKTFCEYQQIPNTQIPCQECEKKFDTTYMERSDPDMFDDADFRLKQGEFGSTLDMPWLDGR